MKIGITGSKGFIGKHLTSALKEKRNIKLSFFDRPENDLLNPNINALKKFVSDNDVIIHTAAINRGTDIEIVAGSVVGTYNLISVMEKSKSRAKLIFLSSIQAETDTVYGQSKKLVEIMLKDFSRRTKAPVSIFRLTNVFGEGARIFYNTVVSNFCHQAIQGQKLTIHPASRNKKLNLIYVEDVVAEIIQEIKKRRKKLLYFKKIGSKNLISVSDLAKLIESFKNLKNKQKSKFHKDLYKTYLSYL